VATVARLLFAWLKVVISTMSAIAAMKPVLASPVRL
jgi:hypothetical protein